MSYLNQEKLTIPVWDVLERNIDCILNVLITTYLIHLLLQYPPVQRKAELVP